MKQSTYWGLLAVALWVPAMYWVVHLPAEGDRLIAGTIVHGGFMLGVLLGVTSVHRV